MQSTSSEHIHSTVCTRHFSWSAVLIGGLIALGLGFLLDVFGKAIGLSLYTTDPNGATSLAIGGFIGLIIGAIATMFTAGYAAGFFAGPSCGKRNFGVVYGFVAWCIGLLLISLFMSNATNAITNQMQFDSSTKQAMTQTSETVGNKIHPATGPEDTHAEKQARAAGLSLLAVFIVFFVGALSACFGGCYGFYCWHKKAEAYRDI